MTERQPAPLIRPRDRRSQIVSQASELFWRQGFDGVSIVDLSDAVGLSSAALYKHFSNKHVLLSEPVRELILAWYAGSLVAFDRNPDPAAALAAIVDATVTVAVDKPSAVGLWYREQRHIPPEDYEEIRDMRRRTLSVWSRAVHGAYPTLSEKELEFRVAAAQGLLNCIPLIDVRIGRPKLVHRLRCAMLSVFSAQPHVPTAVFERTAAATLAVDATRGEQLLAAGARLFREHGYHRVGIDQIAEAAGIQGPSVYGHFDSKGDLLFQLMSRMADELDEALAVVECPGQPEERVEAFVARYIAMCLKEGDLVAVYATELQNLPADQYAILQSRRSQRARILTGLIKDYRPDLTAAEAKVLLLATLELLFAVSRDATLTDMPGVEHYLTRSMLAALRS